MKHLVKLGIGILVFAVTLNAQQDWDFPESLLQGYARSIAGSVLKYHSPDPEVGSSLLVRSLDASRYHYIEWETEPVPENFQDEFATFIWMFGIDVNVDSHQYGLFVNDTLWFSFSNPKTLDNKIWKIPGREGAELKFRSTLIDKFEDFMGYATLKLPRSAVIPGKALNIKVVGESAGSYTWYMTFQSPVTERIDLQPEEALLRGEGGLYQAVRCHFVHLGEKTDAQLDIKPGIDRRFELEPGYNSFQIKLPEVTKAQTFTAQIEIGNRHRITQSFVLKPVRKWTVYFVQHTHTDIGYTRPQSEILPEHLRFIDYALDYCDQTDHFPDDARFRWTCESSWAVREYLTRRPYRQVERLLQRIKAGRIEVTGMFLNMSETADENLLTALVQPVRVFKELGIPVTTAMQNDVNGAGWCLVDYFTGMGVKYMVMGEHGHRALIPFDKPTAFWWESPAGNRLLAFRTEHYMHGNVLGLHTGSSAVLEQPLLQYLHDLAAQGYPFDRISLQYSGYVTDNSPPRSNVSELIRAWNEKYAWPRLRCATAGEFMRFVEATHASSLPAYRASWPDWWTDGFGSAARETAAARTTQAEMLATQGLLAMAALSRGDKIPETCLEDMDAIHDALLFYAEHTFGAAESIRDPWGENSVRQWGEKSAYVWNAVKKSRMLREAALGLIQGDIGRSEVPTIAVFNTLNWRRSGWVEAYIDHEILPPNRDFRIRDREGQVIPAQAFASREDGTYWGLWAADIPPMGFKVFRIEKGDKARARPSPAPTPFSGLLENRYYRMIIDPGTGGVKSLYDKEMERELVDSKSPWLMGQFIYERLSDREQLEAFKLEKAERTSLSQVKWGGVEDGPIWKSLKISGLSPDCADDQGVSCEIRLFHVDKRIEFLFHMRKLRVTEPEAVYVAFPWQLPGSKLVFEAQGGEVVPGVDQIEGTSSDWNTMQGFSAVRNGQGQIVFTSKEVPLVHLGGINLGKFQYISQPEKSHIFSWVLNNYWTTNFKASQSGAISWSYAVTSSPDNSRVLAARFGWASRVPMLARVFPASEKEIGSGSGSFLQLTPGNILLVCAKPSRDRRGVVLHLRELNGSPAAVNLDTLIPGIENVSVTEVNALEEPIADLFGSTQLRMDPYAIKFVKLEFVW